MSTTHHLPLSHSNWRSAAFADTFAGELRALPEGVLPLNAASAFGGHIDPADIGVSVLSVREDDTAFLVVAGLFFREIVAACSCGDEPSEHPNYCELEVRIDRASAAACFRLLSD